MKQTEMHARQGRLFLTLPFALKDSFRAIFKTADWDREEKAFSVADTSANRRKWDKFLEVSASAAEAVKALEQAEVTEKELERAKFEADKVFADAQKTLAQVQARVEASRARINALSESKSDIEKLIAAHLKRLEAMEAAAAELRAAEKEATAPGVEILNKLGAAALLEEAKAACSRGSDGCADYNNALAGIAKVCAQLREAGFKHEGLEKVSRMTSVRRGYISAINAVPGLDDLEDGVEVDKPAE